MRIISYREVPKTRRFLRKLLKDLIDMDYANIPHLKPMDEGSADQWVPVFEKEPEGYRLLVDGGKIKGYWDFVALDRGAFRKAERGRLLESCITASNVRPLGRPGRYDMYFVSIVLAPELRDTRAIDMLSEAFYEAIEGLAAKGVYFVAMCTNAYTRDGVKMFRKPHKPRHKS